MWAFDKMFSNVKTSKIMKVRREAWIRQKDTWFSLTEGLGDRQAVPGYTGVARAIQRSCSTFLYRTLRIDTDKVWHQGSKRIQRSKLGNPHASELEAALEEQR